MKPSRLINGTFLAMIVVQTVGSIDSRHRLPAPKQYVAISVLWGILFLMADTAWKNIAARLSILVLLTGMITGPFGKTAINFLNMVTQQFAINPDTPPTDAERNPMRPKFGRTGAVGVTGDTGVTQS